MSIDDEQRRVAGTPDLRLALRTPGRHTRALVLRLRMRTLLALGGLAIIATIAGRAFGFDSTLFLGCSLVLLAFILVVYRRLLPLVDRHDRGAVGEEHVGGLLNCLPRADWRVVHDVSFGNGNVDHIAIGPPGVFSVETKSHPGPITVQRLHGALLRQAHAQQKLLQRLLHADVEPLIVYSRAWVDRPLARRKGVRVLPARMLPGYLRSLPRDLDDEAIDRIHASLLDAIVAERAPAGEDERGDCPGRSRIPAATRSSFSLRVRDRDTH